MYIYIYMSFVIFIILYVICVITFKVYSGYHLWAMTLTVIKTLLLLSLVDLPSSVAKVKLHNTTDLLEGLCSLSTYPRQANCTHSNGALICSRGFTNKWLMRILDWPGDCINVGRLQKLFPELQTLDISNSTVLKYLKGHFDSGSKIEKIDIHGLTSLWEVPAEVVQRMTELKVLDLRNNVLRHMKANLIRGPPQLETVYLSDNNWDCSDGGLNWLAMENDNGTLRNKLVDYYKLVCHQQLYRGKPLHKMVMETCPEPCVCAMTHVVSDSRGALIPLITVDCSRKQLENPPMYLPPSTTTLRLDGNKINSIRQLAEAPQYKNLMNLFLDNNNIQSVKELEGSEWFSTFRVLSLKGNMLKQIPVYVFDKAFQGNNDIMHVYLGNNPWRCDCHFIPRFQALLLKYKRVIRDLADIRCAKSDDKTISLVQISTMPLSDVCSAYVEMPISTMNIVNLLLFLLIILVVGRFIYDWHRFRSTGKLPWISSILP